MLAGLDVGGTFTDAALVDGKSGRCIAWVKAPTRTGAVLPGILESLERLLRESRADARTVKRLTVSSTLGLNALLTGNTRPVGVLALPGPGIDPALFWPRDPLFRVLPGAQDHRGRVTAAPDPKAVGAALESLKKLGAKALAIVCKFSPKNPELEKSLAAEARKIFGADTPIVLGFETSGSLNFPRRLHTAWCNAALCAVSRDFHRDLEKASRDLGLTCPIHILKADAGSFSATEALRDPASTMGSGPAAGLLGILAMARPSGTDSPLFGAADKYMIDMGGTSTDIALLAAGQPLLAREGLTVSGRPTLIRTLWTRSIALGGDSALRCKNGEVSIGPDRSGPALSLDPEQKDAPFSRPATLTDALNVLDIARVGDTHLSRHAFMRMIDDPACPPAVKNGQADPEDQSRALARLFLAGALRRIKEKTSEILEEINSQPVYTIRELLVDKKLEPECAMFIGAPAGALRAELEKALVLPVVAPEESPFANALGAALARPTKAAELYADTLLGRMTIPDFRVEKNIGSDYRLEDAGRDMSRAFAEAFRDEEPGQAQTVFAESFAVLDPSGRRGRILRIRSQYAAGLVLKGEG
ncbi:MAG: hydantoinase/oxoprolinase family protein [Desulfovibrio sp.]|jgi:N-methylhydantoinase A/oxoprolinase/acetone carboxylase beta subunit|nr:hydantoinase/oxoprolinase family protein [Desulfovibrio sp.]